MQKYFLSLAFFVAVSLGVRAQSHYPGQHAGKFVVEDQSKPARYSFDLRDVTLLDSRFRENMEREQQWLLAIQNQQLLHSFRTNAGIYSGNEGGYFEIKKLGGWESLDCELRGHSTGHIMSGLALMYASTGDQRFKLKGDSLVSGLAEVQKVLNQNGYLSAYPQELINRNLAGKKVWAPWYTLHKIFAGLLDQYLYCDNQQALEVASGMASWAYQKLQPVSAAQRSVMLRNEFGGINECFYNLYAITGNKENKWLAEFFYHNEMLDPLQEGRDILDKKHANTYIPKLLGLARNYELEGTGEGGKTADFFWQTVIGHHSFATGSNSDREKFFQPDHQSGHLTGYTGESCNVYNMLKLTRHLFCQRGDVKYADYYEKALYNHILGQQDPATGMVSYFLPMLPGAHKVYSTPENSFWCCVGSGFENQAKYGEAIYYHNHNSLFVNLFIPSQLDWKSKGIKIRQETAFPQSGTTVFTIEKSGVDAWTLHVRNPSWVAGAAQLKINGKSSRPEISEGYIAIDRKWKVGDKVEISFPMALGAVATNDNKDKVAFTFGPIVLAGDLGTAGFREPAPYSNPGLYNDYYTYNYQVPEDITRSLEVDPQNPQTDISRVSPNDLTFRIEKSGVTLRPLYDIHRSRYVVYWDVKRP